MGFLFNAPKAPKPDPAAAAALKRQQDLADNQLTEAFATGLLSDSRQRLRNFGFQPAGGGGVTGGGVGGGGFGGGGPGGGGVYR